jgi:hypothetical protein
VNIMQKFNRKLLLRALSVCGIALATALSVPFAFAGPQDYRFEFDGQPVRAGNAATFKIRLVHVPDGKPVTGAIIIQTKFDMGPDGMADMGAPAKAAPTAEPGVYVVETQPSMGGKWALTLAAKVQGETETVRGTVVVPVTK